MTLFGINVVPFGIGSVSTIFVEGTVPLFCKLIVYVITSPISTKIRSADFVGLTVAVLTETVVGAVGSVVVTGGLVGSGWYVYVVEASFAITPPAGICVTRTWKDSVLVSPGLIVPTGIPSAGFEFGTGTLFKITLFGMNVVPVGMVSVKTTFVAGIVPSLVKVIVYVITSPISTVVLSAVLTGFVIAVLTGVVVGGVGFVVVIAGFVGSG